MNILNELTVKNLKQNKKRTLVTILGIMLSVALVTAITTFISSMQGSMVEYAKKRAGNYHMMITDVPKEEQKYFLKNEKIEKVTMGQTVGDITVPEIEDSEEEEGEKPIIRLKALDEESLHNTGQFLTEGELPKNEHEVVFPMNLVGIYGIDYRLGQEVELCVDGVNQTYTICGFSMPASFQFSAGEYGSSGYTVITKLMHDVVGEESELFIRMKQPKDAYTFSEELIKERGYDEQQIITNNTLLTYQGVTRSEHTMSSLYKLAAVVLLIIILTSVFVIKNSFDISITERIHQYGMLASIGATSKQIRKNVMFEGIFLGIVAVPLGVLCGIVAIWIALSVVMWILNDIGLGNEYNLQLHISILAIVAAVLIATLTIFLSAIIPARKAAKITPIDAMRETKDVKISGKKLRTPKVIRKILGIEGEIADKNLKRSRKKYRTTVFSIFLSVVLFVSISSMMKYAFLLQDLRVEEMNYNLMVYVEEIQSEELSAGEWTEEDYRRLDELKYEAYRKVQKLGGIKQSTILKSTIGFIEPDAFSERTMEIEKTVNPEVDEEQIAEMINVNFYSVPDEQYREYLKEIGLSYEEAENKAIVMDTALYESVDEKGNPVREQYHYLKLKEGDTLRFQEARDENWQETEPEGIEIVKRVEEMPFGVAENMQYGAIRVILSDKMMNQYKYAYDGMRIDAEDTEKLTEEIEKIDEDIKWNIQDFEAAARESKGLVLIISIFVYGFIAVISVIGITNVFNTITTNMMLRSREFAILKSVGMTEKEFRRMIRYESVLYGVKALTLGLPVGVLLSYLFHRLFVGILVVPYELPWQEMGIATVFVFLIIFLMMGYAVRKTKKQNIIETIRTENI